MNLPTKYCSKILSSVERRVLTVLKTICPTPKLAAGTEELDPFPSTSLRHHQLKHIGMYYSDAQTLTSFQ